MSTTEPLPLVEQGRIIAILRRQRRAIPRSYRTTRRWSDAQLKRTLGMSHVKFQKANRAYAKTRPRSWTHHTMATKILAFAIRNDRWPDWRELDQRNRELDLPPRSSISYQFPATFGGPTPLQHLIEYIVNDPELHTQLTPALVLSIRNVTVRRQAMERYGIQALLHDGGGECIQQDDAGKLWRLPSDNPIDAHAQWVEVINATAEPDGSYAHYFLRVPPHVVTARDAVAWTFSATNGADFQIDVAS